MINPPHHTLHAIRSLDLGEIDAVGFDLDHTLALYDDDAVNRLAAEETLRLLGKRGYRPADPVEVTAGAVRGLSLDLRHGNVLKIGADGRIRLARRGSDWLSGEDIAARYHGHDPANEGTTWHIHSPFDAPTLWFYSTLGPRVHGGTSAARLLQDIRTSLDASHTRGALKDHLSLDLSRFVAPAGDLLPGLERWRQENKRLFVVTNSDRAFAARVLDHVLPAWREVFDVIITGACKPGFFAEGTNRADAANVAGAREGRTVVIDAGNASRVEEMLGVPRPRVLYVGDNGRADVAPARRRGWRTVHVVAEMDAVEPAGPWAGALDHEGFPTWFARAIFEHADAACARVDALLAAGPHARLACADDFYTRIIGPHRARA
jgi:HAD superfamily 5'-nucleotidase-like hydrolase